MRCEWRKAITAATAALALLALAETGFAVRIKDLGRVYGPMDNQLVGYGLVVGLPGTGDDAKFTPAVRLLSNMLSNAGAESLPVELAGAKNVAVVEVSATLPAFNSVGDQLDVHVAALGNAKSLAGGRLVLCPLGNLQEVFAVASGRVTVLDGSPTVGTIERGATVQKSVPAALTPGDRLTFKLLPQNADFSIASSIVKAIHQDLNVNTAGGQAPVARAVDAATIEISLSESQLDNPVPFISQIERLVIPGVDMDMEAKVVINERDGVYYAINGNVEISRAVVGYNNVQIDVNPDSSGDGATLEALLAALTNANATPEDVVGVIKALEAAGALHAKVVRE